MIVYVVSQWSVGVVGTTWYSVFRLVRLLINCLSSEECFIHFNLWSRRLISSVLRLRSVNIVAINPGFLILVSSDEASGLVLDWS